MLHKISLKNQHMLAAAHRLLRSSEAAIKYFLRSVVFPLVTQCREAKLSATGQVLGGDMLFRHRLGCDLSGMCFRCAASMADTLYANTRALQVLGDAVRDAASWHGAGA